MDLSPYYPLLRATSLLRHMRDDELDHLLHCFNPHVRRYQKGELRQNLKDDKVLQKALEVLADPALYRKTLSKPEDVPAVASK